MICLGMILFIFTLYIYLNYFELLELWIYSFHQIWKFFHYYKNAFSVLLLGLCCSHCLQNVVEAISNSFLGHPFEIPNCLPAFSFTISYTQFCSQKLCVCVYVCVCVCVCIPTPLPTSNCLCPLPIQGSKSNFPFMVHLSTASSVRTFPTKVE